MIFSFDSAWTAIKNVVKTVAAGARAPEYRLKKLRKTTPKNVSKPFFYFIK